MDTVSVMLCCMVCRRHTRRANLLKAQFDLIDTVYPGTVYVCVLDGRGEMIAQQTSPDSTVAGLLRPEELAGVITTLRRSVAAFAGTLQHTDTQVVHIKGERHLFSSYGLPDNHVLAFYSIMPSEDIASWDCADADAKLDPICRELQRLLAAGS
ncbi:Aste57867_8051 [Aphanomyces stellatus]|uniref:Aste57867_8051 protein n=1 Tax=Aphanomyces stellatus TaxID=120398 RepID=A0A485KJA9_9STRA|nr:hypothetical protein As57867_008021 [Aphanomyces stellatus]VFT84943.1 Aste57867_8051 [Aphanomyces stellatus]